MEGNNSVHDVLGGGHGTGTCWAEGPTTLVVKGDEWVIAVPDPRIMTARKGVLPFMQACRRGLGYHLLDWGKNEVLQNPTGMPSSAVAAVGTAQLQLNDQSSGPAAW